MTDPAIEAACDAYAEADMQHGVGFTNEQYMRRALAAAYEAESDKKGFVFLRQLVLAVEYEVNDVYGGDCTIEQLTPIVWKHAMRMSAAVLRGSGETTDG